MFGAIVFGDSDPDSYRACLEHGVGGDGHLQDQAKDNAHLQYKESREEIFPFEIPH